MPEENTSKIFQDVNPESFLSSKQLQQGYSIKKDPNSNRFFVTKNDKKVGQIELFGNSSVDAKGNKWGSINIEINPSHRNKGLSKPLYDAILNRSSEEGLSGIRSVDELLQSPVQSQAIRKYYSGKYSTDKNILDDVNRIIDEDNAFAREMGDTDFTPNAEKVYLIDVPKQLPGSSNVDNVGKLNFSNKLSNAKDQLFGAIKGTNSVLNEIKGELLQGKVNRESIKKGNEWLEKWINHPATKEKINTDIGSKIDFAKNFIIDPEEKIKLLNLIRIQSKHFKPNSKEYSLLKQLDNNLNQYSLKKHNSSIHQGNWGVSYQHGQNPYYRQAVEEGRIKPFDRYGSWISRTTKLPQNKRIGTTIHEGTHDWVSAEAFKESGMRNIALKNMNPKIKEDFLEWELYRRLGINPAEKMGTKRAHQAYLADPTELHARIMELRYELGLNPSYKMKEDYAKRIIEWIEKGETFIDRNFVNVIDKDPKKLAELFNKFWAVPPAAIIATGAASQYKQGGSIQPLDYFDTELTDQEIEQYKKGGCVVVKL